MELNTVTLGQTFTAPVDFYDQNNNPFAPKSPASYVVRDFNNNQITSGLGAQDGQYPQRWSANISIPENAPFDPSLKYSITWTIVGGTTGSNINTQTQLFNVIPPQDIFENKYTETVIVYGSSLTDTLILDGGSTATNVKIRVLDENDTVYLTDTLSSTTASNFDGNNSYYWENDTVVLPVGFRPFIIEWQYLENGRSRVQYHFVYVISSKMLMMMENLRNLIDKVRFSHPNINLRYTEADLMYYLTQGITIINGTRPQVTSWTLNQFPMELDWYLTNCAAYVALSAQYLAEGVSAFEFNGASVTLNIDRAQFIDSALQRITDTIDNKLPIVKTNLVKASSVGVLHLTYSPSFNPGMALRGPWAQGGFPGDSLARLAFYENVANNLLASPI